MRSLRTEDIGFVNAGSLKLSNSNNLKCEICGESAVDFRVCTMNQYGVYKTRRKRICQTCLRNEITDIESEGDRIIDITASTI